MGRHSRKGPAPAPGPSRTAPEPAPRPYEEPPAAYWPEPAVTHEGYASPDAPVPGVRAGGHPRQYEPGGAWGAGPESVYGDWHGVPRTRNAAPPDYDTPAFGTPAVGFPQVTLPPRAPSAPSAPRRAVPTPTPRPAPVPRPAPDCDLDPVTSTGSHRRVPGPRTPADAVAEPPGSSRGLKVRTYTGMAAAAVTTVLAVVVVGQLASDGEGGKTGMLAAPDDGRADAAASRSDGRPTPDVPAAAPAAPSAPAPELTYEQKMAQQLPIDAKLVGPGTFDTVPGVAKALGKGKLVRYRVDVEQGLGLDPQLFAEAVHRTLNDRRSWAHGGAMTFERVPGGEAEFVITLASPGTTGTWCAKSGLDTTIDNVSCDSASTDRVMINAFRWAQGSSTYGPDQMVAYRQMLINHEVGHRLGHGHVSCRTPGSLAPIMQQQTKSLDVDGIQCKPNPWVYPGG